MKDGPAHLAWTRRQFRADYRGLLGFSGRCKKGSKRRSASVYQCSIGVLGLWVLRALGASRFRV